MRTGRFPLFLIVALSGCLSPPEASQTHSGVLRVFTASQNGQYRGQPDATFVRGDVASFPESRATLDTCVLAGLGGVAVGQLNSLDAGDSIAFTTDSGTFYLVPGTDLTGTT